jgi:hypothetical protein
MKTTPSQYAATSGNQISCAKISRETREPHASPRHEMAGSLAKFTGIAIAKGSFMKTIYSCLAILILSLINSSAMEGLKVAVISTNAVLTWPSTNDGETYLVQYRSNLTSTAWTTIADYLPASGSNTETFVDVTNIVTFGNAGTNSGGGGGGVPPNPGDTNSFGTGTNTGFVSYTGFYQVVRDGAYMYIDNTNWSGLEQIPVELGNSYGTAGTMALTDIAGDTIGNSVEPAGTLLTVDTTQMTNGVQDVSLSTSWADISGDYIESDSLPTTVNVYNEISFPDWVANYGSLYNAAEFNFTLGHTNAQWECDVYGSSFEYIGSFNGDTTTNTAVNIAWDLVDGNGETRTNDTFFECVITEYYNTSGSGDVHPEDEEEAQALSPTTHYLADPWIGHGGFAIAQQHAWESDNGADLLDAELNGFLEGAQGQGWNVAPPPQGGNPYAIGFGATNDPTIDATWAAFRTALYNPITRNVCYFGHGGITGIGYNPGNTNRFISATEIGAVLNNIPAGQTNAHHFRFVFLDGCSTAKGNLCTAFGIPQKSNVPDSDFANAGLRYAAFMGWPKDKVIGILQGSGYVNYDHINFITWIQQFMAAGQSVSQAELSASREPGAAYGSTAMTIYGSWDLTFTLDN